MDEMGHTHPALALRVYRQAMRRGEDEREALGALVEAPEWPTWANGPTWPLRRPSRSTPTDSDTARLAGGFSMGAAGFEPATSRV